MCNRVKSQKSQKKMAFKTNACQRASTPPPPPPPPPQQQPHHHETVIVKAGPLGIVPAVPSAATISTAPTIIIQPPPPPPPPTIIEPVSRTYQYRKVMKPMLERKRRARINRCLDELKELMVTALQSEGENVSKLEKADILELTVRHLHKLKRQQRLAGNPIIDADRFRAGFTHAANEVSRCLAATPGVNIDLGRKLMTHLGHRLNDLDKVQPLTIQIGQQSQQQSQPQYQNQNPATMSFNDNNNNNNIYSQSSSSSSSTTTPQILSGDQSLNQQRLLSPLSTASSPLCCDVKYMMPLTPSSSSSSGCSSNYSGTPSPELSISCSHQQMDYSTSYENQTQDLLLKVVGGHTSHHPHPHHHHHHHLKEPVWRPW